MLKQYDIVSTHLPSFNEEQQLNNMNKFQQIIWQVYATRSSKLWCCQ